LAIGSGRLGADDWPRYRHDLDGDGVCEVLAADRARQGHALLLALRGDGTSLWERSFYEIPGKVPDWNFGALTFWWASFHRRS
jgi:hypothetical protein